jgi:hypothetical protein
MSAIGIRLLTVGAALGTLAWGADPFLATWKMRATSPPLESSTLQITVAGVSHRLTYHMTYVPSAGIPPVTEIFLTNLDGRESVATLGNGEPVSVKMAISRIDERHWTAVVRTGGQVTSTSKAEVSADGKVLKIDSQSHMRDGKTLPQTQFWDRQ